MGLGNCLVYLEEPHTTDEEPREQQIPVKCTKQTFLRFGKCHLIFKTGFHQLIFLLFCRSGHLLFRIFFLVLMMMHFLTHRQLLVFHHYILLFGFLASHFDALLRTAIVIWWHVEEMRAPLDIEEVKIVVFYFFSFSKGCKLHNHTFSGFWSLSSSTKMISRALLLVKVF